MMLPAEYQRVVRSDHAHEPRRPVILVTGTSSGIGLEIIRQLKDLTEFRVVATARSASLGQLTSLGFVESDRFLIRPLDVTSHQEQCALFHELENKWDGVDILINNAGISYRAVVEHMREDEEQNQMDTNYFSAMALIRLALPGMRRRCRGHIINISSVSGMMAMPTMSSYSASKFALEGASEALWYELRPWNIHVTLIQPGFIRSESFRHVHYSEKSANALNNSADPYHAYYNDMAPFVEKLMRRSLTDASAVARNIIRQIKKKNPPLRVPATLDAHLFHWLRQIIPRRYYHSLLYRQIPGVKNWEKNARETQQSTLD